MRVQLCIFAALFAVAAAIISQPLTCSRRAICAPRGTNTRIVLDKLKVLYSTNNFHKSILQLLLRAQPRILSVTAQRVAVNLAKMLNFMFAVDQNPSVQRHPQFTRLSLSVHGVKHAIRTITLVLRTGLHRQVPLTAQGIGCGMRACVMFRTG